MGDLGCADLIRQMGEAVVRIVLGGTPHTPPCFDILGVKTKGPNTVNTLAKFQFVFSQVSDRNPGMTIRQTQFLG